MTMVERRKQLRIGFHDLVLRYILCLCKRPVKKKVKLYQMGEQKLERTLDIVEVMKEVRNMSLVSQIILSKYQKALIPYFHCHLIENTLS
mmetsp:Transcript_40026/g.38562  ORF Transcript_40026/g.38562 Transcript_40026/m.38562 type:complete len:90 (+) Transcript_40026:55-324(+)